MYKLSISINCCLILFSSIYLNASPINLTENDMYVSEGFDIKWIEALPDENNKAWQKFPGNKDNRSVRVRELKFKDIPKFKHFSIKKYPDMTFTYVTSFELSTEKIKSAPLGLYLGQIGLNWEVYLNGNLIKSEMHLSKDGSIDIERAVRDKTIALNHYYLKPGKNILAFKIVGNPIDDRTGLYMKKGYIIDSLDNLKSFTEFLFRFVLIAIYIFFGLYHLFLYIIRRKEIYNLSYSIFTIVVGIYWFCRLELIFAVFQNTYLIKTFELISISLFSVTFLSLVEHLTRKRITLFTKIWAVISIIISILIIFIWKETLLRIVQLTSSLVFIYGIIYAIILPFGSEIYKNYNILKETKIHKTISAISLAIIQSFIFTIPGNLLITTIIFITTGILDVISINSGSPKQYSTLGLAFFLLGIAAILANRFVMVHNKFEELNISLEQKVEERTEELSAANEEMAALNENLIHTRDELVAANEEMHALNDNLLETRDQLWGEMELARKMQTVLLPKKPLIKGYEICPYMKPAQEVGGDYYDIINFEGYDWLIIGDVSGHGFAAGLIMMMVQTAIHASLERHPDDTPSQLLSIINRTIRKNLKKLADEKYMTITVFAVFENGKLIYSGLHQDIIIYRKKTKQIQSVDTDGLWIGIIDDIESFLHDNSLNIEVGDILLLYTDGITEAWKKGTIEGQRDAQNDMYGHTNLIKRLQEKAEESSLEEIKNNILKSLDDYDYDDDITLLLLKRVEA